jgi:hypothetical protein
MGFFKQIRDQLQPLVCVIDPYFYCLHTQLNSRDRFKVNILCLDCAFRCCANQNVCTLDPSRLRAVLCFERECVLVTVGRKTQ